MGWRQSKESFQHVLHSSYPCSGPTRARPCALLRPFIIDYVLSCNKASQSNPLIRETDTQSCAQRMEPQPFLTRHWGYGRLADEQNPQRRGCLGWTGICTSDVASPSKSGPNQCHTVFCRIFDSKFEGVSLLADSCECRPWPSRLLCHTRSVNGKHDMAKHKRFGGGVLRGVNRDDSMGQAVMLGPRDTCHTVISMLCIGIDTPNWYLVIGLKIATHITAIPSKLEVVSHLECLYDLLCARHQCIFSIWLSGVKQTFMLLSCSHEEYFKTRHILRQGFQYMCNLCKFCAMNLSVSHT